MYPGTPGTPVNPLFPWWNVQKCNESIPSFACYLQLIFRWDFGVNNSEVKNANQRSIFVFSLVCGCRSYLESLFSSVSLWSNLPIISLKKKKSRLNKMLYSDCVSMHTWKRKKNNFSYRFSQLPLAAFLSFVAFEALQMDVWSNSNNNSTTTSMQWNLICPYSS